MRKTFKMTQEQLNKLLDACKPVPLIAMQCGTTRSQQERANDAWKELGNEMGFDPITAEPICGCSDQTQFTAVPKELK